MVTPAATREAVAHLQALLDVSERQACRVITADRTVKAPEEGTIIAGHWAIICEDPEAEARRIGPHLLYQANEYIRWGAFGPPETTPLFPDAEAAIANGLYEIWDVKTAVEKLGALIEAYPQIKDIHFWAQFPGETVDQG